MATATLLRSARALRRAPAYSAAAVVALALGIGASAALFSVVNGVLLRPLPYAEQARLVVVDAAREGRTTIPSYPQLLDWRAASRSFDGMAYAFGDAFLVRSAEGTDAVGVAMVSDDFFGVLRGTPALGRLPSPEETRPGAAPVAVLSRGFWRTHFGGDPGIVGRTVDTDKGAFTVVGVMPAGFAFPEWAGMWTPLAPMADRFPAVTRREHRTDGRAVARLRAGTTLGGAARELEAAARSLAGAHPDTDAGITPRLSPLAAQVVGDVGRPLLLLAGAVAALLLIACANVGTLSLVRGGARARELAVRSALGATRGRVAALLLAEGALLAAAGGAAGLVVAHWLLRLLRAAAPGGLPRLDEIALDGRAVLFTTAVAALTPLLFGLAPALHAARADVAGAMRRGGRGATHDRGEVRLRAVLLVAQVALSLVLLVGAGLLARSFVALRAVRQGYEPERLVDVRVQPPAGRYGSADALLGAYARLHDAVGAVPGVERVALVNQEGDVGARTDVRTAEHDEPAGLGPRAVYRVVSADYFATVGQPLLRGRGLTIADMTPASRAAVVSARLAAELWPGRDPLGRPLRVWKQVADRADFGEPLDLEVVGVAADAVFDGPGEAAVSVVYLPVAVNPPAGAWLMVRARGDRAALVAPIRRAVAAVDPGIATNRIGPMRLSAWQAAVRHFDLVLVAVFGATALVLTVVGLSGVVAYVLTQRRHELGVRRALGATDGDLVRALVGQGVRVAALGVALGTPLALAAGGVLRTRLFGVGAFDPPAYLGAAALLVAVAAGASWLPARRATRVPATEALRAE